MFWGRVLRKRCLACLFILYCFLSCSTRETPNTSLTILLPEDILTVDPNREFETITDSVLFNVYEPLVGLDENLNLQPVLAESWENPTPEEWRFHLRKKIRFHDGTYLNESIVREALETVKKSAELETSTFLTSADRIEVLDQNTVSIITRKPYEILFKLPFIYIVRTSRNGDFLSLVGTGPYRLRQWEKGKYVTLAYWEQYRGARPDFRNIRFVPVVDVAERYERLKKHQADIMYGVPAEWARQRIDGVSILQRPGLTVYYLGFNLAKEVDNPFRDLRVRQAIHLAL